MSSAEMNVVPTVNKTHWILILQEIFVLRAYIFIESSFFLLLRAVFRNNTRMLDLLFKYYESDRDKECPNVLSEHGLELSFFSS